MPNPRAGRGGKRRKRAAPPPPAPKSEAERGSDALASAIQAGRVDVVRKAATDPSFNPDFQNGRGSTALMTAVWFQKEPCVKALLEAKASPNVQNIRGNTALHFAYEVAHETIKQLLLDAGADKDVRNSDGQKPADVEVKVQTISHNGVTVVVTKKMVTSEEKVQDVFVGELDPMEMVTFSPSLSDACCKGDRARCKKLIELGVTINGQNKNGSTVLMDAVWFGHLEVVKLLIDCGAKPNIRNNRKNTALHFAYEKGQKKIIEFLEEHGAAKSLKWKNGLGLTPPQLWKKKRRQPKTSKKKLSEQLKEACRAGEFVKVMDLLAKGADANYQDYNQSTPLMNAVYGGHLDVVMLLVKRGAKPNMTNKQQKTALHFAYERKNQPIIKFLLGKGGKVVKNDHQRRGLSFTPRGSQIGAEYEVTTLIEDDEEEDVAAGSPSAKQIRQSLQAAATNEDELRSIFDRFDRDKNGALDRNEFDLLLQKFSINPEDANHAFEGTKHDKIDFDEFTFWFSKIKQSRTQSPVPTPTVADVLRRPDPEAEKHRQEAEDAKQRAAAMQAQLVAQQQELNAQKAAMEAELREARSKMEAQMAAEKRKMEEQMLAMKQAAAEEMQQQKVDLVRQASAEQQARLEAQRQAAAAELQAQQEKAAEAKKKELDEALQAAKKKAYEDALAMARKEAEEEIARSRAQHEEQAAALMAAREEDLKRVKAQEEARAELEQQQREATIAAEEAEAQLAAAMAAHEADREAAAREAQEAAARQSALLEQKQREVEAAEEKARQEAEAREAAASAQAQAEAERQKKLADEQQNTAAVAGQRAGLKYAMETAQGPGGGGADALREAIDAAVANGVDEDDILVVKASMLLDDLMDDDEAASDEVADPSGCVWEEIEELGQVYYLNTVTGETTWTKPQELLEEETVAVPSSVGDWEVTEQWGTKYFKNHVTGQEFESAVDPETGDEYFIDTATGEATWTNPVYCQDDFDLNGDELAEMVDAIVSSHDVSTNIEDADADFDVDDIFRDLQNGFQHRLDTHIGEKLESASGIEDSALSLIGDKAQYDKDADLAAMEKMKHATIAERNSSDFVRRESQVHNIDLSKLGSQKQLLAGVEEEVEP